MHKLFVITPPAFADGGQSMLCFELYKPALYITVKMSMSPKIKSCVVVFGMMRYLYKLHVLFYL